MKQVAPSRLWWHNASQKDGRVGVNPSSDPGRDRKEMELLYRPWIIQRNTIDDRGMSDPICSRHPDRGAVCVIRRRETPAYVQHISAQFAKRFCTSHFAFRNQPLTNRLYFMRMPWGADMCVLKYYHPAFNFGLGNRLPSFIPFPVQNDHISVYNTLNLNLLRANQNTKISI